MGLLHLTQVLMRAFPSTLSEFDVSRFYGMAIDDTLGYLNQSSGSPTLVPDLLCSRDTSEPSSATVRSTRPDLCCWSGSALLLKGEDKPNGVRLDAAKGNLMLQLAQKVLVAFLLTSSLMLGQ